MTAASKPISFPAVDVQLTNAFLRDPTAGASVSPDR
jgi:hypothetical protein